MRSYTVEPLFRGLYTETKQRTHLLIPEKYAYGLAFSAT
jgi:hypothetical protein